MTAVRISLQLDYRLALPAGQYGRLDLSHGPDDTTQLALDWSTGCEPNAAGQEQLAREMLRQTNRLLRWYRHLTRHAQVVELTLAQVGAFSFVADGHGWGPNQGRFEVVQDPPYDPLLDQLGVAQRLVKALQDVADEPPVWHLLLLDAQLALAEDRFREAVLLSWSAIESCFNTHYRRALDESERLTGLTADERDSLAGRDISLVNKMTAGWALVYGTSLHDLARAPVWSQRQVCYKARNAVIHEGRNVEAVRASETLAFAQSMVETIETAPPTLAQRDGEVSAS